MYIYFTRVSISFPGGASGKEPAYQCRRLWRCRLDPWVRKSPLEEGMATQFSILAWRIPLTEETGGLPSIGSQRVRHDWNDLACTYSGLDGNKFYGEFFFKGKRTMNDWVWSILDWLKREYLSWSDDDTKKRARNCAEKEHSKAEELAGVKVLRQEEA